MIYEASNVSNVVVSLKVRLENSADVGNLYFGVSDNCVGFAISLFLFCRLLLSCIGLHNFPWVYPCLYQID